MVFFFLSIPPAVTSVNPEEGKDRLHISTVPRFSRTPYYLIFCILFKLLPFIFIIFFAYLYIYIS